MYTAFVRNSVIMSGSRTNNWQPRFGEWPTHGASSFPASRRSIDRGVGRARYSRRVARNSSMVARLVLVLSIAACTSEPPTELAMSFSRDGFYDAPFPSDDLRTADGHIDLTKLPDPAQPSVMAQALALIAGADGFAQTGAIYFRATAPLDSASLPDLAATTTAKASVFLVSVDPSREDFLRRRPIDVAVLDDGGPFGAPDLLALLPLTNLLPCSTAMGRHC